MASHSNTGSAGTAAAGQGTGGKERPRNKDQAQKPKSPLVDSSYHAFHCCLLCASLASVSFDLLLAMYGVLGCLFSSGGKSLKPGKQTPRERTVASSPIEGPDRP